MFIILFGVTGSGKTTVGHLLAQELGWKFYDADQFHPAANVEKMRQGIPLTEEDRRPWLGSLRDLISQHLEAGEQGVLACSALRASYRRFLQVSDEVKFVFLKGSYQLIEKRLRRRRHHFMNPALLQSQFETLEEPDAQPQTYTVDIAPSPAAVVRQIRQDLKL